MKILQISPNPRSLKAFTLLEVTVAMLIAAIAIAITYTAYTIVNKSYRSYDLKNKRIAELVLTDKLLKKDFISASSINRTAEGIALKSKEGNITYEFTYRYILRNQNAIQTDTFPLRDNKITCLFLNTEVSEGDRLDNLKLESSLDSLGITLNYYKLYSAEELF